MKRFCDISEPFETDDPEARKELRAIVLAG
jgi:hypothetical protein